MTFDINDYILQLKSQLCTWRNVYWRIWGTVNYLICMRCEKKFPCYQLGHCDYHPEQPRFNDPNKEDRLTPIGIYPCCHQKLSRFNPTNLDKVIKLFFIIYFTVKFNHYFNFIVIRQLGFVWFTRVSQKFLQCFGNLRYNLPILGK